ncbi:MAG: precorrin-3B C(17)-methyltransferase, partial [Candidatus Aenigmatarchaeota archaeon]
VGLRPRVSLFEEDISEDTEVKVFGEGEEDTGKITGLEKEIEWIELAVEELRKGKTVSLLSAGDPGIYGIAGLVFEYFESKEEKFEVEVVPGITALNAAASSLGAPLMQDVALISLSDLLAPWEVKKKRLASAAKSDFVIAIYNPKTKHERRNWQMEEAYDILLEYRSPDTPTGIVRRASREDETTHLMDLEDISDYEPQIDFLTLVIVGNSSTFIKDGRMVTARGHQGNFSDGSWGEYLK